MSDDRPGHEELRRRLDRLSSDAPAPADGRERTVSRARRRARIGMTVASVGAVTLTVAAVFAIGAIRGLDRGNQPIGPTPTGTVKPAPSDSPAPTIRAEGQIAYWSDRSPPGGEARLMVVGADGTGAHELGDLQISTSRLSWSPDGQQVVFDHGTGEGRGELDVMDTATGDVRMVFDVAQPSQPDVSPDGSLVVFSTDSAALFIIANEGGSTGTPVRTLGPDRYLEGLDPTWSPDGSRLAFVNDRTGEVGIVRVAGTTPPFYLDVGGRATSLDWGRDGLVVAVARPGEDGSLVAIDPREGSVPRALADPAGEESDPAISPDGTFVAFTSDVDGQRDLYLMNLTEGSVERLTHDDRLDFSPDWRPTS